MRRKDVEKLLGISEGALRYYEENGLVNPEHDKNNYRIYNLQDIFNLIRSRILIDCGMGVSEIADLIQNGSFSEMLDRLEMIQREKEDEIADMMEVNSFCKNIVSNVKMAKYNVGRYWIDESAPSRYFDCTDFQNFGKDDKDKFSQIMKFSALSFLKISVPVSDLKNNCLDHVQWKIVFEKQIIDRKNDPVLSSLPVLPSRTVFQSYIRITDINREDELKSQLRAILNEAEKTGYQLGDRIEGFIYSLTKDEVYINAGIEIIE